MSGDRYDLYACLYGKQNPYQNASDLRRDYLRDNRRGVGYHVEHFGDWRWTDQSGSPVLLFFEVDKDSGAEPVSYTHLDVYKRQD